jgi:hypothetical protein
MPFPARDQQVAQNRASPDSHITQNWRGRPLVSHEIIIQLIANITAETGLKIYA